MSFYAERIFPRLNDLATQPFAHLRARALEKAAGNTLEIGAGTGLNFPHYPKTVTRLTAIEPSPGMIERARPRSALASVPVELVEGTAEKLPFPDSTFDTVAGTLVFCSVTDPEKAAREVWRVLKPGGQWIILEHIRSINAGTLRWQQRWNPLWRRIFLGCTLDRDLPALLASAGFDTSGTKEIDIDSPAIVRHLLVGEAIKQ